MQYCTRIYIRDEKQTRSNVCTYVCIRFHLFSLCFPLLQTLRDFVRTLEILLCALEVVRILSRATLRKILRCIIDLPDISQRMHMHGEIFYCVVHGISMPLITNDCSISTCVVFTAPSCDHRRREGVHAGGTYDDMLGLFEQFVTFR